MVEKKQEKPKEKHKKAKRERKERRFAHEQTRGSTPWALIGMAGALALGAGVYGQWIRDPAFGWAQYLVAGGALVLGGALWFGDSGSDPVRIGDAGVAIENGSELTRLPWCDMKRIFVKGRKLVLEGDEVTLELPIGAHRAAVSWLLKEAVGRVPDAMDVKQSESDQLPEPKDSDGELVNVENLQVAGKHCASSDKPIAFERDARLCPTCAQVYHREHVPKKCVTCGDDIAGRAYQP